MQDDQILSNTEPTEPEPEPTAAPTDESTVAVADDVVFDDMAVVDAGLGNATLVVKRSGAETEEVFPINSPAVIGRFDPGVGPVDVDLGPLPEGVYVSRKHARLTCTDDIWSIEDLGSSNGTFILRNGDFERVESSELADGDEIALGNARFVFHLN